LNTQEALDAHRAWHDKHAAELRIALAMYSVSSDWMVREYSRPGLRMQLQGRRNALVEVVAMSGGGWLVNGIETQDLMMTLAEVAP
jgi:hypothetical protein